MTNDRRMITRTWLEDRIKNLSKLADEFIGHREKLQNLEQEDIGMKPISFSCLFSGISYLKCFSGIDLRVLKGRYIRKKSAISLPYNSFVGSFLVSFPPAYLTNEEVVLRMSSKTPELSNFAKDLIENTIPDVSVDMTSGKEFFNKSLEDDDTEVVMVFGHDSWIDQYKTAFKEKSKKLIFEGPGKDPFIILQNTDIPMEDIAKSIYSSFFYNSGQACASPERLFVPENKKDEIIRAMKEAPTGTIGSFYENPFVAEIKDVRIIGIYLNQLKDALDKGANIVLLEGDEKIIKEDAVAALNNQKPIRLPPIILDNVTADMDVFHQENFSVIIPITCYHTKDDLIEKVNDSEYGLTAVIFGYDQDLVRQLSYTHGQILSNSTIIDAMSLHYYSFSWGGYKRSGWVWAFDEPQKKIFHGPRVLIKEFSTSS